MNVLFSLALLLMPMAALCAPSSVMRCHNLDAVEDQYFPAELEITSGIRELTIKVQEKGSENAAVAQKGHTYHANRVARLEEARYHVPTYYVTDNLEGDLFANDERDTATYLFIESKVLDGQSGKLKLWLHYSGGDYRGVQSNKYSCLSLQKKGENAFQD